MTGTTHPETPAVASRNRSFALFRRFRFQMPRGNIMDICLDAVQTLAERAVYMLGPFLIVLALGIMSLLAYTFFCVILPMIMEKHANQGSLQVAMVVLHGSFVVFLLVNILFNYIMCVLTKNDGPLYDRVVRELATVTEFRYPETPAQIMEYRRDFADRMAIRMRRRRARETGQVRSAQEPTNVNQSNQGEGATSEETGGPAVTHRRGTASESQPTPTTRQQPSTNGVTQNTPSTVVRSWMLMGPYEWGFCGNSMQPKPPRSHYDHVTKKLVLNLDHYCPWIFNAVGYFNYRYFVNFLIFVFCGMCYGMAITLEPFLWLQSPAYTTLRMRERQAGHHLTRPHPMLPRREEKMLVSLSFMLCLAVGIALVLLGGFHIYLTLTAQTTIEFHGNWAKRKRIGSKYKNPYDQGWKRNWKQIYGNRPWYTAVLPSPREPDYLPVPIPGKNTLRADIAHSGKEFDPGV